MMPKKSFRISEAFSVVSKEENNLRLSAVYFLSLAANQRELPRRVIIKLQA